MKVIRVFLKRVLMVVVVAVALVPILLLYVCNKIAEYIDDSEWFNDFTVWIHEDWKKDRV